MSKSCEKVVCADWPDKVQVVTPKNHGGIKDYYPERTCREKHLAYLTVGCSECGVEWREDGK